MQEIYDSNLVDIRKSTKSENISFRRKAKNRMSNIFDESFTNSTVSRISNNFIENSSSNELNTTNSSNASNASNSQNLNSETGINLPQSRDLTLYDWNHVKS